VRVPKRLFQVRISAVLGSFDDLIQKNARRVEVLEEMARKIYQEWFIRLRFPGHETATFIDSQLGPVPKGWEILAASEILLINPPIKTDAKEHPFITMADLHERGMVCLPREKRTVKSGSKFENGDTLFARITPCLENGKTGLVQALQDGEVGRGSTEFIVLRGRLVGPAFTYCLARSDSFRANAIQSMSGASGRQRVRNECFDSYRLAVPPSGLAEHFEQVTASMLNLAYSLTVETSCLATIRDLLLPKLVTGQADVSSLDLGALIEDSVA
jgi:type I restriction enzyme, S subunit